MSRSYKKQPVIKDKPTDGKRAGNKSFRRKEKQAMANLEEDKLPQSKSEVVNDYEVCDYKTMDASKYNGKGKKKRINK